MKLQEFLRFSEQFIEICLQKEIELEEAIAQKVASTQIYSGRFERRPEFLFGNVIPNVIDANVREGEIHGLKVIRVEGLISRLF